MALRGASGAPVAAMLDPPDKPEKRIADLRERLGPPGAGRARQVALAGRLKKAFNNPYVLVVIVLLGWGVSEYLLVLTGRAVNWQTGMFYNCLGVITVNLFTIQSGNINVFRFDKWVVYAVLTGVLYGGADLYFLKLSGNKDISHMADVSVLAPLCALYVLIPTILGLVLDGEPLTKRKLAGIVLATVAILILSFEEQGEVEEPGEAGGGAAGEGEVGEVMMAASGTLEGDELIGSHKIGSYPRVQRGGANRKVP